LFPKKSLYEYEKKPREQQELSLRRKAAALGYDLVSKATEVPKPRAAAAARRQASELLQRRHKRNASG
jgi:hypothetical protein